ncbi:MAG: S-layer homology domain-containing protein [Clostridia bacterium]|nr:S-layer homology domain-containing protein [Clostridia bacterium]
MKKIIATLLLIVLFMTAILTVVASPFRDVADDAYYAAAAERMAKLGILTGYDDGLFYGHHYVTRAQMAALGCKILGKVDEALSLAGKTVFNDVDEKGWYTGYINYAVANGIVIGDGDGNFRPDDKVKYEEAIKVIICVLGLDKDIVVDPADWSKGYLEAAKKMGLTNNLKGKKGEYMVRGDVAVICDAGVTASKEINKETVTSTVKTTTTTTPSKPVEPEVTTKKPSVNKPSASTTTAATTTAPAYTTREDALPGFGFGN